MQNAAKDKSLGELFADLSRETSNLVRKEVQLAKTEMSQNVARLAKNAALLVVAAVLLIFAMQALLATAILALVPHVGAWQAALIVTLVLIVIAGSLAMMGIKALKKGSLAPTETVKTLQEDVQWAKEQI